MKLVSVEFKKNGKRYIFYDNNLDICENDYVVVDTERGQQFGQAVKIEEKDTNENHALVLKIASESDLKTNEKNIKEAEKALIKAQEIANDLGLEMKFIDSFFTFDQKQLVFHFLADSRVDFRDLAKSLAGIYKTRIELRQVGVRDKAKEISGVGPCGRKLCCSCFLNDLDSVGISMVKNQNLSLNPNKINGLCGRLLCCLKYEDDVYTECRKKLPEVGNKIKDKDGFEGKVTSIDILNGKYTITNENNESKVITISNTCEDCEKRRKN